MSFYTTGALPWTVSEADEARFRTILRGSVLFVVVLSLILPWLPVPKADRHAAEEIPPRLAKLLLEREFPPLPVNVPESVPSEKADAQKQPADKIDSAKRVEAARQKASHA